METRSWLAAAVWSAAVATLALVAACAGVAVKGPDGWMITGPDGYTITAKGFEDALKKEEEHIDDLKDQGLSMDDPWVQWWRQEYDDTKAYKNDITGHGVSGEGGQGSSGVTPS